MDIQQESPISPHLRRVENEEPENEAPVDEIIDKSQIRNNSSLIHIVKSSIGIGFLAMPGAFRNVGMIIGSLGTFIIGLTVCRLLMTIVMCSQILRSGNFTLAFHDDMDCENDVVARIATKPRPRNKRFLQSMDYPDIVAAVFQRGARGRFCQWASFARKCTTTVLMITYYGVNIIYVSVVAGTFKQIVDQYTVQEGSWTSMFHGLSIRWYPAIVALIIYPLSMFRYLRSMTVFSAIGNGCMIWGTIFMYYFMSEYVGEQSPLRPEEQAKWFVWPITKLPLFIGTTLFSMGGFGMILHIENAMRYPLTLIKQRYHILRNSMNFVLVANGVIGLFGYLQWGDRCATNVLLNLPSDNVMATVIKVIITIGLLMTYGLQLTVSAELAWKYLRKGLIDKPLRNVDDEEINSPYLNTYYQIMRFILILGTIIVATVIPDIEPFISLVGSVGFSTLGLTIPLITETVWYWYPAHDFNDDFYYWKKCVNENEIVIAAILKMGASDSRFVDYQRSRSHQRIKRLLKNGVLLLLALFTLIDGGYYSMCEIIDGFINGIPKNTSAV